MTNYINKIEDSASNLENFLHLERICTIIKSVLDSDASDIPQNNDLYILVSKINDK
jgi:hypothetical protein